VSTTPIAAVLQGLVKAHLEILQPEVPVPIIPVRFNPTQYQIVKNNTFQEIPIPGLEAGPLQFIRGTASQLTTELLLDTSDTLVDVRLAYTDQLRGLLDVDSELHAPPILRFTWDTQVFVGVASSMTFGYQLFTPEGIPLRCKLNLTLQEYLPVEVQVAKMDRHSPDVDKTWVVRRGDTLSDVAAGAYDDPSEWREVARANGIVDPRTLNPGTALRVPRLK
jgi:nucleoid-associated protein YgaU